MTPDDRKALVELEARLEKTPANPGGAISVEVPWLVRLVRQYEARVAELEAGGIPEVIAQKDAAIAARDAEQAKLAARIAKFERDHLPNPRDYYRELEKPEIPEEKPKEKLGDATFSSNLVATEEVIDQSSELKHPRAIK